MLCDSFSQCNKLISNFLLIFDSFADVSLPEALRHVPLYWACLSGSEEEESGITFILSSFPYRITRLQRNCFIKFLSFKKRTSHAGLKFGMI